MEIWTKNDHEPMWRRWCDPLAALGRLPAEWTGSVLFVSEAPDEEVTQLRAAAAIARRLCGPRATLVAGSQHPVHGWYEALERSGIDHVWHLHAGYPGAAEAAPMALRRRHPEGEPVASAPGSEPPDVIDTGVCPLLHARHADGVTASVCGRRNDRLVLPRRRLERFCLHDHTSCPRWQEGSCRDL